MRRLVTVLAIAFFCTPIGLRAVGVTAHPFENRRLADRPRLSQGFDVFEQTRKFVTDRLPLREQAVHANTWISLHIFHTSPTYGRAQSGAPATAGVPPAPAAPTPAPAAPQPAGAIEGRDGWLYLTGELQRACQVFIPWKKAMARWRRLLDIVQASGRRVLLEIPPDKSTIYPRYLPANYPANDCLPAGRKAAWSAIDGTGDARILGLRRLMLAEATRRPELLYKRKDTHWNTEAAALSVGAILKRLSPHVRMKASEIQRGTEHYTGDLSNIIGAPQADTTPQWTITRPATAPKLAGRITMIYDSFGIAQLDALKPYTNELTAVLWVGTPQQQLIDAIAQADTVIFETVEREVDFRASDAGYVNPKLFGPLERRLRAAGAPSQRR